MNKPTPFLALREVYRFSVFSNLFFGHIQPLDRVIFLGERDGLLVFDKANSSQRFQVPGNAIEIARQRNGALPGILSLRYGTMIWRPLGSNDGRWEFSSMA